MKVVLALQWLSLLLIFFDDSRFAEQDVDVDVDVMLMLC